MPISIYTYHIYPIHILLRWWFHLGNAFLHIDNLGHRTDSSTHTCANIVKILKSKCMSNKNITHDVLNASEIETLWSCSLFRTADRRRCRECPRSQIVPTASAHALNKVLEFEFAGVNLRNQ